MVELNYLKLATGFCGTIIKSDAKAMIGTQLQVLFPARKKMMKYPQITLKITGNDSNREVILEVINRCIKERYADKLQEYPVFELIKLPHNSRVTRRCERMGYLRHNPGRGLYEFSYYD